jgi:hypothetical protein
MVSIYMSKNNILLISSILTLASCGGGGGMGGSSDAGGGYGSSMNTAPVISNSDMNISVQENQTSAFTVNASDANGDSLTYSLSGDDSSLLSISNTGVVTFNSAPDYENPADADSNNIYKITASVSDGSLSTSKNFEITVTNDTSDDENYSAWDGNLISNDEYSPYDKHLASYGLIVAGLPDVTNSFMENIGNIANKILAKNDSTNDTDRNLLLSNFLQYKVLQRVGSTGMSSYDPPLNEENNPGWDNINDNYEVVDFIWEATQNSAEDEKTKAAQLNGILEHLLHTITLIYDKTFTSWGYEDSSSQLVLAIESLNNAKAKGLFVSNSVGF